MLQLSLSKCKELGIQRVLITCIDDNEASRRTILKNGGEYESTVFEPNAGINLQRYWIDLSDLIILVCRDAVGKRGMP